MQRRAVIAGFSTMTVLGGAVAVSSLPHKPAQASSWYTRIPNIEVWAHDGRRLRFYDDLVKGRVVTVNMMFAGCGGICPLITQNLRRVQDLLGKRVGRDVFMYSVTLWPELETPEVLRAYAEQQEVGPGWLFLTGAPADLALLRQRLGFRSYDPERDVINDEHTGMLRFGNEPLDRWSGTAALGRPEWIAKAITSSMLPDDPPPREEHARPA
jgi:protein SCO1/2